MVNSIVAKRYAAALFELGAERNINIRLLSEFDILIEIFMGEYSIKNILISPMVGFSEKRNLIDKLIGEKVNKIMYNFFLVLIEKKRFILLKDIYEYFSYLVKMTQGIVEVDVVVAGEIDKNTVDDINYVLNKITGYKVDINLFTDKRIIGGFVAKIKSKLIDLSIGGYLSDIKKCLID